MKKSFAFILLSLCCSLYSWAQGRSETIVLTTDKPVYVSYDTLYVSGLLVSPDVLNPSELSNYCIVELFNERDTIVARKKVRCDGAAFHARFPLGEIRGNSYLLLRAYTRFMRNFSEHTWPVIVAGVAESGKKPLIPPLMQPEKGNLQLVYAKGVLLYKYMPQEETDETLHLNFYTNGYRLGAVDMSPGNREGCFAPDSVIGDLVCGLLTDAKNKIVASRFLPVKRSALREIAAMDATLYNRDSPIRLTLNEPDCDMSFLLRVEKVEEPAVSLLQTALQRFQYIGLDSLAKIWEYTYSYSYPPEQVLSIRGSVKTETGGRFVKEGTVLAFNNETGYTYDGDIDDKGRFEIGVDDYKEGESFFLQAYNKKGKNSFSIVEPEAESLPNIYLPKVTLVDASEYQLPRSSITVDTMRSHELGEVKVTAHYMDKNILNSQKFYNTNYLDYKVIKERNYVTMEQIVRSLRGVILNGGQVLPTRGINSFGKQQGDDDSNKTFIKQIPFNVDGAWIEYDGEPDKDGGIPNYYLETIVTIADIATIEYIPGIRAFSQYGSKAFDGVIAVTTRSGKKENNTEVSAGGTSFEPTGLSDNHPFAEKVPLHSLMLRKGESRMVSFTAPSVPGKYRVVVEGIGENHQVVYKVLAIEVK